MSEKACRFETSDHGFFCYTHATSESRSFYFAPPHICDIGLAALRLQLDDQARVMGAAKTVLEGFDEGVFVRDVSRDSEAGWAIRLFLYLNALGILQKALFPTEPKEA